VPWSSPRGIRRILLLLIVALAAAGVFAFLEIGRFMAREDPLEKADAIFVFAGTRVERPLEAADLYREGYAPRIVITRATAEQGTLAAERRGLRIPSDFDLSKDVLLNLGVPQEALMAPPRIHDNTAAEAQTLHDLAVHNKWKRVIVVSSKYHLRRIRLAAGRAMRGTGVTLILRGSRYDPATPERWWQRRSDIRWLGSEIPKLILYAGGIST
jgi:uncharacterized SAM-binding protein YcdF (DUF218 family)